MKNFNGLAALAAAAFAAIAVAGCGGAKQAEQAKAIPTGSPTSIEVTNAVGALPLTTRKTADGTIIAGPNGRALYAYETSSGDPIECGGECAWTWLPVVSAGGVSISGGVNTAKVGAVTRGKNAKQVTYGGHPLFYYARDGGAKAISGNGKQSFGATWHTLMPDGKFSP